MSVVADTRAGAEKWVRTTDLPRMKRALCQLSYPGMPRDAYPISVRLLSVHLEGDGAQGGSRTLKTLILSQVPMPVRLLGQKSKAHSQL